MYWYRDGSALSLLPWLAVMLLSAVGGWLLAAHAFRLERRERLIVGLGLGVVLYTWLANLLGHWLAPELAFALPGALLLATGLVFAWRRTSGPWLDWKDLNVWPWLLAGLVLFWLFMLWGKGLALFDEQKNLSLISIIATGDIPPRFALDDVNFLRSIYHYGFHVFGASLMRLGGMLPWSAFDTAKAVLWALSLLTAGLLGRRYVGAKWASWGLPAVLALATGTRYLLLLLPPGFLLRADREISLIGTSAFMNKPFSQALISGWTIDGGPPMPYIFGFLNGIMDPLVMAHQGPNTFSVLILLVAWLLLTRLKGRGAWLVMAALFSMWALAWEATYGLFVLGLFGYAGLQYWNERSLAQPHLKAILAAALLSVPVALSQGGTLTEMARGFLFGIGSTGLPGVGSVAGVAGSSLALANPAALAASNFDLFGFSLRWPPAIFSAHLGALNLFSPVQLVVALFELGPVILYTPWITRWAWRRARAGDWPLGALLLSAWFGLLIPIFFAYQNDRDISRLEWQALLTWTLMLAILVGDKAFKWKPFLRGTALGSLALMMVGGLMVAGTQMTAVSSTQLADGFTELDAAIVKDIWDKYDRYDRIFGPLGNTTILTGHITGRLLGEFPETAFWNQMWRAPRLQELLQHNYQYVFVDSRWWNNLPPESQQEFDADCVEISAEVWDNSGVNFRRMLDLRGCTP